MNPNLKPFLTMAANWQFFSLLFQYPDSKVIHRTNSLCQEILPSLQPKANKIASILSPEQAAVYHVLIGSAGSISPYESDYQIPGQEGIHDKGAILGDVAAFYKAFRFEYATDFQEVPDHVAVELAFLGYIKLKEAYALAIENQEDYQICSDAEKKFLNDHLLPWLPQFLEGILNQSQDTFYQKSASLLQNFIYTCQ